GAYALLDVHEAGGPVGGDYDYVRSTLDLRAYRPVLRLFGTTPRLVLAGRIGGGVIDPYEDHLVDGVPLEERLYLGGSSTVRGWTENHLGPLGPLPCTDDCVGTG